MVKKAPIQKIQKKPKKTETKAVKLKRLKKLEASAFERAAKSQDRVEQLYNNSPSLPNLNAINKELTKRDFFQSKSDLAKSRRAVLVAKSKAAKAQAKEKLRLAQLQYKKDKKQIEKNKAKGSH
jgi:hypothetical protein